MFEKSLLEKMVFFSGIKKLFEKIKSEIFFKNLNFSVDSFR